MRDIHRVSAIIAITISVTSSTNALAESWGVPSLPKQGGMTKVDTKIPKSEKIPPVKNTLPKEKPIPKVKGKLGTSGKSKKGKGAKMKEGGTIIRDANGHITGISYPNGKSASFKYGSDGSVNKIEIGGVTFEKGSDGTWKATGADGKGGKLDGVNVNMNENGTLRFEDKDGNVTLMRADGSRTTLGADGSRVDTDGGGRTNDVRYPSGTTAHADYDSDGNLSGIKTSSGGSIERGDDGSWRTNDGKGGTSEPVDGKVSFDDDGSISYEGSDGTSHSLHPDGTNSTSYDDGSTVHRDSSGRVDGVDYPDGKSSDISYDSKGNVDGITYGDNEITRGKDGNWYNSDGEVIPGGTNINVDQETGDITFKTGDGVTVTKYSDGSHEAYDAKGRKIGLD